MNDTFCKAPVSPSPPIAVGEVCSDPGAVLCLQLDITEYWDLYNRVFDEMHGARGRRQAEAMPSSGLLGEPPIHLIWLAGKILRKHAPRPMLED